MGKHGLLRLAFGTLLGGIFFFLGILFLNLVLRVFVLTDFFKSVFALDSALIASLWTHAIWLGLILELGVVFLATLIASWVAASVRLWRGLWVLIPAFPLAFKSQELARLIMSPLNLYVVFYERPVAEQLAIFVGGLVGVMAVSAIGGYLGEQLHFQ